MNFVDAVNNMKDGKRMARPTWGGGFYSVILYNQNYIWQITKDNAQGTNAIIYIPSVEDISATDWFVKY